MQIVIEKDKGRMRGGEGKDQVGRSDFQKESINPSGVQTYLLLSLPTSLSLASATVRRPTTV